MIITRTPFRISFFGGGTDYPAWYQKHGGEVLSTTIDKYCYITCRHLPPFFEHKHRIVYSAIENVRHWDEIKHPAVRGVLELGQLQQGPGDPPRRRPAGALGPGLELVVHRRPAARAGRAQGQHASARSSWRATRIHIEQNVIGESVGSQDQVAAAYGGFNRIEFLRSGGFQVSPVIVKKQRLDELQKHLMLCFTGFSRIAAEVAQSKIANLRQRETRAQAHARDGRRGGADPAQLQPADRGVRRPAARGLAGQEAALRQGARPARSTRSTRPRAMPARSAARSSAPAAAASCCCSSSPRTSPGCARRSSTWCTCPSTSTSPAAASCSTSPTACPEEPPP